MGCCGQKRAALKKQPDHYTNGNEQHNTYMTSFPREKKEFKFKYMGSTCLTIRGAFSSKKYAFRFYGDEVLVDEIDASSMMAEPLLQNMPSTF